MTPGFEGDAAEHGRALVPTELLCPACGYNLTGATIGSACPACGVVVVGEGLVPLEK